MNERIKELSAKALDIAIPETYTEINLRQFQKFRDTFAELIVKECVRHFNEDYQRDFDTLWREDLSKSIREHFGIEE